MEVNNIVMIVAMLVLGLSGFIAALLASESMEELRGKILPAPAWVLFVAINVIMGALIKVAHPMLYVIVLVILAILQLANREGSKRRGSWNNLALGYSIVLILSTVQSRIGKGFTPWALLIIVPIVLPFIAGAIQYARLNGRGKKRVKTRIDWGTITLWLLAIAAVAVAIAMVAYYFTRG